MPPLTQEMLVHARHSRVWKNRVPTDTGNGSTSMPLGLGLLYEQQPFTCIFCCNFKLYLVETRAQQSGEATLPLTPVVSLGNNAQLLSLVPAAPHRLGPLVYPPKIYSFEDLPQDLNQATWGSFPRAPNSSNCSATMSQSKHVPR